MWQERQKSTGEKIVHISRVSKGMNASVNRGRNILYRVVPNLFGDSDFDQARRIRMYKAPNFV